MIPQDHNPLDDWTVTAAVTAKSPGFATVAVGFRNGRAGELPRIMMTMTWTPGMEAADVEAHALRLLASSARALGDTLEAAAKEVSLVGEPLQSATG